MQLRSLATRGQLQGLEFFLFILLFFLFAALTRRASDGRPARLLAAQTRLDSPPEESAACWFRTSRAAGQKSEMFFFTRTHKEFEIVPSELPYFIFLLIKRGDIF